MQEEPESEGAPAAPAESLLVAVGIRIREARKRTKLSQADLAKLIGSGQSYIFQIEAGETNITLKTLARIAAAIDLSPRELLPTEHSKHISAMLHVTMQELDRISDRLREVYLLVADDPSAPTPDTLSKN